MKKSYEQLLHSFDQSEELRKIYKQIVLDQRKELESIKGGGPPGHMRGASHEGTGSATTLHTPYDASFKSQYGRERVGDGPAGMWKAPSPTLQALRRERISLAAEQKAPNQIYEDMVHRGHGLGKTTALPGVTESSFARSRRGNNVRRSMDAARGSSLAGVGASLMSRSPKREWDPYLRQEQRQRNPVSTDKISHERFVAQEHRFRANRSKQVGYRELGR